MYLGPADRWPAHPRAEARTALEEARATGWWFRPSEGHTFGRLRCAPPESAPTQDACIVPVYSTSGAEDGSDTARVIRDALRKCPHERNPGTQVEQDPESVARLAAGKLAQIAALIEAAEALRAKEAADRAAHEAIEEALRQLAEDASATVDNLEDQTNELERLALVESGKAYAAASRANAADPWPPEDGMRELVSLARAKLAKIGGLIRAAGGSVEEGRLRAEQGRLNDRLERLSSRLSDSR